MKQNRNMKGMTRLAEIPKGSTMNNRAR